MKIFSYLIQCLLIVLHSTSYSQDDANKVHQWDSGTIYEQTYQDHQYNPYSYQSIGSDIQPPFTDASESIRYQQQAYQPKSTKTATQQNTKISYGTTQSSPASNKKKRNNDYDDDCCFCFMCIDTSNQEPCCSGNQHNSTDHGFCDGFGDCGGCDFDCSVFD